MDELIFVVENGPEGGYTARALGESIFTDAEDLPANAGSRRHWAISGCAYGSCAGRRGAFAGKAADLVRDL